jgi:hypothetical protein
MGREDAPDGRIVRVDVLAPSKHLFCGGDTIADCLWIADRGWCGQTSVGKHPLDGTDPVEPFSQEVGTVDLHNDAPVVG